MEVGGTVLVTIMRTWTCSLWHIASMFTNIKSLTSGFNTHTKPQILHTPRRRMVKVFLGGQHGPFKLEVCDSEDENAPILTILLSSRWHY